MPQSIFTTPCDWMKADKSFRYDVRLLLDTLPEVSSQPASDGMRLSPTGWSDLPSDAEDTFFFSPDELADIHREKRRRMIDGSREERLRALRATLGEQQDEIQEEDPWGGSDEEVSYIKVSLSLFTE